MRACKYMARIKRIRSPSANQEQTGADGEDEFTEEDMDFDFDAFDWDSVLDMYLAQEAEKNSWANLL